MPRGEESGAACFYEAHIMYIKLDSKNVYV